MTRIWYPPYNSFKCIGPDCPMNCCAYYAIRLFKREEAGIAAMGDVVEPDGDGLRCKSRPQGGCIFWTDAKLCSLQRSCGEKAMPVVCRTYPRIIGNYGSHIEFGAESCCPVVSASVENWEIGDFITEGEAPRTEDPRFAKRDEAVRILADRSLDFHTCLEKLAELYGSDAGIPEIGVTGDVLEFLRRETALMCWSYLVYFDGVGEVDNLMSIIITAVSNFDSFARGREFGSWWEMGLAFSRLLVDYYISTGFDIDHEDRYCDVLDYSE